MLCASRILCADILTERNGLSVTFYPSILEVLGWNPGHDACYPEAFRDSPPSCQANAETVPRSGHDR
jgi:hypothetical protein